MYCQFSISGRHGFTRDFIDWPYSSHYFGPFLVYFHGCSRLFKGIKLHLKPLQVIYLAALCLQHTLCLIAKQKKGRPNDTSWSASKMVELTDRVFDEDPA